MAIKNKYHNKKTIIDGIKFDSRDEALFYRYLQKQKAECNITDFERQPKYELQPKFKDKYGKTYPAITYSPDFIVYKINGSVELIDIKSIGTATQQGELRKKMFIYKYPDLKLTWISRDPKYATFGEQWVLYEELKKLLTKKNRDKKNVEEVEE